MFILEGHTDRITDSCLCFAPDGLRAAAGGANGHIVVWDLDQE